jgi:hypothetical protein
MTSKQRIAILATWWPRACDVQNWRPSDREKRLEIISEAIGRPISSMCELNNADDIDKVKAYLGMLAEDLDATAELTPAGAEYGYRRRLFWLIRRDARPLGGEPYILALARDKFGLLPGWSTLEDLTTARLHQLMLTLHARQFSKGRQAKNASLTSEEQFPDETEFQEAPEPELVSGPF